MRKLTEDGILTEQGEDLGEDGAQFKGVFVRGLAALDAQAPDEAFAEFLRRNADSVWERGRGDGGEVIGPNWAGEEQGKVWMAGHAAGLDVLVAAAQVG